MALCGAQVAITVRPITIRLIMRVNMGYLHSNTGHLCTVHAIQRAPGVGGLTARQAACDPRCAHDMGDRGVVALDQGVAERHTARADVKHAGFCELKRVR